VAVRRLEEGAHYDPRYRTAAAADEGRLRNTRHQDAAKTQKYSLHSPDGPRIAWVVACLMTAVRIIGTIQNTSPARSPQTTRRLA